MKIGFDNEKYLALQAEHIRQRMSQFGGKLYLEFGGKLFDDYHASRVLPGFEPDSKIRMLQTSCGTTWRSSSPSVPRDIEKNKIRGDLGITLRSGRAAADRRLPGHGPVCGQRGASPSTPASLRRMPSSTG